MEKAQKGGVKSVLKINKCTIQDVDFLIKVGKSGFSGFSQIQMAKNSLDFDDTLVGYW